ncbi:MAG: 50S ribosomal protein L15 [bacterium]
MRLFELKPSYGEKKKKKRIARGVGSGHGVRATRGQKGQQSRTGKGRTPGFEGGQNPLYRRLPKINNFSNKMFKIVYQVVNVGNLNSIKEGAEVNKAYLADHGYIRDKDDRLKILGNGELKKALTISADKFTGSAKTKIESAGGKALVND